MAHERVGSKVGTRSICGLAENRFDFGWVALRWGGLCPGALLLSLLVSDLVNSVGHPGEWIERTVLGGVGIFTWANLRLNKRQAQRTMTEWKRENTFTTRAVD
jgi:hypothetical protein